jgi:peptidyl-prolyl cis-trans isomerase SurA
MFAATLGFCANVTGCQQDAVPADAMAKVNGRIISRAQMETRYRMELGSAGDAKPIDNGDNLRLAVLQELITEEMLRQQAERLHVAATPEEIEERFDDLRASFSKEDFDAQIKAAKMSVDELKQQIRRVRSQEKLFNMVINSKIKVTDADISNYYAAHKEAFNLREPSYHLAEIVVGPNSRSKAAWLLSQLEQGADFGRLASSFSEDAETKKNGGDMGLVPESRLNETTGASMIVSKLKASGVTEVLSRSAPNSAGQVNAYVIYKLIEKYPAGQRDLADPRVQQSIRVGLRQERAQILEEAYLERLRNMSYVENYFAQRVLSEDHAARP